MKRFDTLYKRTKTGAVQEWSIVADDSLDGYSYIMKAAGQVGGKLIDHNEHIREGKQGRTHYEQACAQAESDWLRKKDSGYKSLKDLGLIIVRPTAEALSDPFIKKLDDENVLAMLQEHLPKFNSDAAGNVKPMLAKDWKKVKSIQYPCIIEPKLDGVRCLLISGPEGVQFISRSGKDYTTLGHIENSMQEYPEVILDGEIYSDELTFQEIVQAVKKQYPNSLKLKFRAYDIVNCENQTVRRQMLNELVPQIGSEHIVEIGYTIAKDTEAVKHFHDQFVQEGNEGAMLRMFDGKYEQGFRSSSLLKVKEFDETEFPVERLEYGQRGVEDLLAVCQGSDGIFFRAKIQGTLAQKIEFEKEYQEAYETEKSVNLTIKHFGWTTDKLPRFPIGKSLRTYE